MVRISLACHAPSIRDYSLHSGINGEQHEKHLYNQSSHYGKYKKFDHQDTPQLSIRIVGVLLNHGVSLSFASSYFEHFG